MTCECFKNDFKGLLNFRFTSKFALIHVNIPSLQIKNLVVLVKQKIWNINNKHKSYLDMQYLHMNIS